MYILLRAIFHDGIQSSFTCFTYESDHGTFAILKHNLRHERLSNCERLDERRKEHENRLTKINQSNEITI